MIPSSPLMNTSNTGTTGEARIMAWAHSAEDQSMHDPFVGSIFPIHKLWWWCPTITMLDCLIVTLELQSANMAWSRATGNLESWFAAFSMIMANLQEFFKWCFADDILWLFGLVSCSNLNLYQFRLRMWCLWFWSMFLRCIFICGLRFQPCIQYCIQCICVVGHSVQLCWKNLLCRNKFMSDCIFHIIISRYLEFEGRGSLSHTALFCHDSRCQSNKYTFCPLMCHRQNTELFEVDSCQVKSKVKSNVGASVCDVLHKMQANDWRAMISLLWVQGYSNQCRLQNDCVIMNCYKHHITQLIYVDICSCVHFNIWCKQSIL